MSGNGVNRKPNKIWNWKVCKWNQTETVSELESASYVREADPGTQRLDVRKADPETQRLDWEWKLLKLEIMEQDQVKILCEILLICISITSSETLELVTSLFCTVDYFGHQHQLYMTWN